MFKVLFLTLLACISSIGVSSDEEVYELEEQLQKFRENLNNAAMIKAHGQPFSSIARDTEEITRSPEVALQKARKQFLALILYITLLDETQRNLEITGDIQSNAQAKSLYDAQNALIQWLTNSTFQGAKPAIQAFKNNKIEAIWSRENIGIFSNSKNPGTKFAISSPTHYLGFYQRMFENSYTLQTEMVEEFATEYTMALGDEDFTVELNKLLDTISALSSHASHPVTKEFLLFILSHFCLILDDLPLNDENYSAIKLKFINCLPTFKYSSVSMLLPRRNLLIAAYQTKNKLEEARKERKASQERKDNIFTGVVITAGALALGAIIHKAIQKSKKRKLKSAEEAEEAEAKTDLDAYFTKSPEPTKPVKVADVKKVNPSSKSDDPVTDEPEGHTVDNVGENVGDGG